MKCHRGLLLLTSLSVTLLVFASPAWGQLPPSEDAPKVGSQAPDFSLPDKHGQLVTLSKLLEEGTAGKGKNGQWVLLVFYRGYW